MTASNPTFEVTTDAGGKRTLAIAGDWTVFTVQAVDQALRALRIADAQALDVSRLGRIDTSGAYLLDRTLRRADGSDIPVAVVGEHGYVRKLVDQVRAATHDRPPPKRHAAGFVAMLERIGRGAMDVWSEFISLLSFVGQVVSTMAGLILKPHRIRWTSVVSVMEEAGLDALPIVSFLAFFIGLVIAFLGANLLAQFGAAVFTVELIAFAMLREFGVVLTGILLAGRTDSAFTAQIGSMKMRQEIDAMRVIGLDPIETLVAPRVIALLIMTPLLAFAATVSGIVGGIIAAWLAMDISPSMFISRFQEVVLVQHFWTGILKAPVIAVVIAIVGCRQGLLVEGDVNSLGRRTTTAVVQSIFLVIAIDALFAIIYFEMGL